MSRCFVLGAGFSKAISGLPLMNELAQSFWEILEKEKASGNNNRVHWGQCIKDFFEGLELEFFAKPCIREDTNYKDCNLQKNIEAILSFIDLNLSGEIEAKIIRGGEEIEYNKSPLFWNHTNLNEVRTCIQTYIYLALIEPKSINTGLLQSFISSLSMGDAVITFNYDLILETAMYNQELWQPIDGYGIRFTNVPGDLQQDSPKSYVPIYKLHGSFNWEWEGFGQKQIRLQLSYDDGRPIFSGYFDNYKPSTKYVGKHSGLWILPSFIKQFDAPQLLNVWRRAAEALEKANEIIVIGYSLPKEDSAASLLFGTHDLSNKKIIIVDPTKHLLQKYQAITGSSNLKYFPGIEKWLCPG